MTRTRTTIGALAIVLGALLLAAMFSSPRAHAQEPEPEATVIVDCYGIQGYDANGAPIYGFIPCDQVGEEPCQVIAGYDAAGQPVYRDVPCDDVPDCEDISYFDPDCHGGDPNCELLPSLTVYIPQECCPELLGQIPYELWLQFCGDCPDILSSTAIQLLPDDCDEPTCEDIQSFPSPEAWWKECGDCKDLLKLPTPELQQLYERHCTEPSCDDFNSYPSPEAWVKDCFDCEDLGNLPTPSLLDYIDLSECDKIPDCDDPSSFPSLDAWFEECFDQDCDDPATFPSLDMYHEKCDEPTCEELQRDCGEPTCEELQRDDCEPDCEDTGDCLVVETPTPAIPQETPVPPDAGTGTAVMGGVGGNAFLLAVLMVAGGGLLGGAALSLGRSR